MMDLFTTLLIAIGLAMDAFAVSLGAGTSPGSHSGRRVFRLAFHFGLFQGGMTAIGWLAGSTISHFISTFDHWIALVLLGFVGVRMVISGFKPEENASDCPVNDPSRGGTLVLLSICLLYTSDAADDLLCVDLGGRRIIKKKNKRKTGDK